MKHFLEEASKRLDTLANHVLDFSHELFLHSLFENNYFNGVSFVNNISTIVGVFKDQFELIEVAATLKLNVVLFFQETLSQGSANGFRIAIVHVKSTHFQS